MDFVLLALVLAQIPLHRRDVRKKVAAARRETRQRLVGHLRRNPRGIAVLDNTVLRDITAPGPLIIFGEGNSISGSMFLRGEPTVEQVDA